MVELAELGLAETNGKDGKREIWNLTPVGQKALANGNELPPRAKAGTGAKAVRAGCGPHDRDGDRPSVARHRQAAHSPGGGDGGLLAGADGGAVERAGNGGKFATIGETSKRGSLR